jgi:adenylosuccinate synthase
MSAVVIVGAQWGDEGKGKVVDLVTEHADVVVRYAGGPNAGHTLVVGDEKVVVRLIPSGILQPHARCVMAQGMVIDAAVLVGEIDALEAKGIVTAGRLAVSELAHVILPYHILIDGLRENAAADKKIGTTKKGIGPAYEDKVARRGVRLGDLRDLDRTRALVEAALAAWAPTVKALGGELPSAETIVAELAPLAARLLPLAADTSKITDDAVRRGERVLLEGAQGTLLDVDHGTYPFVTSSSAVAGGACTGVGLGPSRIDRVVGITKAYATRVGAGPFPTELSDATGDRIRTQGGEFGSVTGRPRRTGWLDLPGLRYAARVNGIDGWAITKLDVLTGLEEVRVCVAYETASGRTAELPLTELDHATPVYESFPGWTESLEDARTLDALPSSARALVARIEELTETPAYLVSVGARRDRTITLRDVFAPSPR